VDSGLELGRGEIAYLLIAFALIVACGAGAAIWLWNSDNNLASDEPPLNAIGMPLRSVRGGIMMDGGSVWVGIEDSKGVSFDLTFPYDHSTKGYPQAFYGVKVPHAKGAIPLSNSVRAREIALIWLREAKGRDEYVDEAFEYLSGRNRSIIARVRRDGLRGIFE
jgi:hypothetical protein